jgi:hypothetical protein
VILPRTAKEGKKKKRKWGSKVYKRERERERER